MATHTRRLTSSRYRMHLSDHRAGKYILEWTDETRASEANSEEGYRMHTRIGADESRRSARHATLFLPRRLSSSTSLIHLHLDRRHKSKSEQITSPPAFKLSPFPI